MAYEFKERWCSKANYTPANRTFDDIKYIVIHYTGNDGDTDENNGNYFGNNSVGASAHYFVDDDSVTRSVADKNIAWHCGANTYYHKYCRNSNSIGIEICDDVRNGSIYPSVKTIENALLLTQRLMKKYNIPAMNVIRHYDVSHKLCPAYWCGSASKDDKWKTEFWDKLSEPTVETETKPITTKEMYRVGSAWKNGKCVNQKGAFESLANAKTYCDKYASYSVFDSKGNKVYTSANKSVTNSFKSYVVTITSSNGVNIRKGAGTNHAITGSIAKGGAYTIVAESTGQGAKKWGKLKSGAGWIALDYTKKI